MAENRRLGRGLSTLIPTQKPKNEPATEPPKKSAEPAPKKQAQPAAELPNSALRDVPVESISKNPHQPRVHFDEDSLSDLAKSIKEIGVLQPLLVREPEILRELLVCGRFLESREVLSVQVLHQCLFHRSEFVDLAHDDRHGLLLGELRSTPAPFACDQLVTTCRHLAHEQWLQHADFLDRLREIRQ